MYSDNVIVGALGRRGRLQILQRTLTNEVPEGMFSRTWVLDTDKSLDILAKFAGTSSPESRVWRLWIVQSHANYDSIPDSVERVHLSSPMNATRFVGGQLVKHDPVRYLEEAARIKDIASMGFASASHADRNFKSKGSLLTGLQVFPEMILPACIGQSRCKPQAVTRRSRGSKFVTQQTGEFNSCCHIVDALLRSAVCHVLVIRCRIKLSC